MPRRTWGGVIDSGDLVQEVRVRIFKVDLLVLAEVDFVEVCRHASCVERMCWFLGFGSLHVAGDEGHWVLDLGLGSLGRERLGGNITYTGIKSPAILLGNVFGGCKRMVRWKGENTCPAWGECSDGRVSKVLALLC